VIAARPATVPSFKVTFFAPVLDISRFAYAKPEGVAFQHGFVPHDEPPSATLLARATPAS